LAAFLSRNQPTDIAEQGVYIQGSIRNRKWEDHKGNERRTYEVVIRHMRMLSSANGTGTGNSTSQNETEFFIEPPAGWKNHYPAAQADVSEEIPF
jgi:single-stranded DNA-binding protein